MGRWTRAAIGMTLAALGGCDESQERMDQAVAEHASGDLEGALTTLELLVSEDPDSEAARAAKGKAASWLVAAADSADSPYEKEARLDQALTWNPDSGAAHVRKCELLVGTRKVEEARACIGKQMQGKIGAPADRVAAVKKALANHDDERSAGERKRWLESPSAHHWKALAKKYPESSEAKQAQAKIERSASLCADMQQFIDALIEEMDRQKELAKGIEESGSQDTELAKRMATYDDVGKTSRAHSKAMKDLASAVEVHALADGEEPARANLRSGFWVLADSASALSEALERHPLENLESYDSVALGALRRWSPGVATSVAKAQSLADAARTACAPAEPPPTRNE